MVPQSSVLFRSSMSPTIPIGPSRHSFPLTASLLWTWACLVEAVAESHRSCGKDLLLEDFDSYSLQSFDIFFMTDSHASVRLIVASISLQTGTQPPAQPSKCLKCLSEQWGCWRRSRFVELVLCWKHHWWWWGFHIHWKSEERRYNGQVFWTR